MTRQDKEEREREVQTGRLKQKDGTKKVEEE